MSEFRLGTAELDRPEQADDQPTRAPTLCWVRPASSHSLRTYSASAFPRSRLSCGRSRSLARSSRLVDGGIHDRLWPVRGAVGPGGGSLRRARYRSCAWRRGNDRPARRRRVPAGNHLDLCRPAPAARAFRRVPGRYVSADLTHDYRLDADHGILARPRGSSGCPAGSAARSRP